MFLTLVLQFYLKNGQKKKQDYRVFAEKNRIFAEQREKNQSTVTITISVDGKETFFSVNCLNKNIKKKILKRL